MDNYIYKFINYENEIIYIGKTGNIKKRMKQHFGNNSHLPKECYEQVYKIYYANVISQFNAELLETYFINQFHPIYNTDKKYKEDEKNIDLPIYEPQWQEIYFMKIKTKNHRLGIDFLECFPPYINKKFMYSESLRLALNYNYIKIDCYEYEFFHLAPNFMNLINNNLKEIKILYQYVEKYLDDYESNLDEFINATPSEQINENYLVFHLENIKEVAKNIPNFHIFLKYNFIECLSSNFFMIHMITPELLKIVENNVNTRK